MSRMNPIDQICIVLAIVFGLLLCGLIIERDALSSFIDDAFQIPISERHD